ncbi:RNA-guided endonuclease InsQ/TnpB family protein [Thermicanus aegyptius]|uniref:RNA-guided endonuclease InsQ/TnpB family protein n=1 Tax=Thermicanus aegyptius TaxID=94009 RepID=UPI00042776C0|nr:RNA-guided endonuclease TnpB family protein [Thermicanus aegyptius]
MYIVRKLKIGKTKELDNLARNAGETYTKVLVGFWRVVRKKGIWLSPNAMMKMVKNRNLHSQSTQAIVQTFFASLKSWRERRKTDLKAKPPKRRRRYFRIQWKEDAIRIKDGLLYLSNGKGNNPLVLPWQFEKPKLVEIGWDGKQYELRATYLNEPNLKQTQGDKTAGIDLGEIHIAAVYNGEQSYIFNGRLLRSKRRYQNKLKAFLQSKIDKKKKGSRRWRRLIRSKAKQLAKIRNQIHDILHKETTKLVSILYREGIQTVVIGDVRDIRKDIDYGSVANQKLHQWAFGKTRYFIQYKAERLGLKTVLQDESYTSQECPVCGVRHKPKGREFKCTCGFSYHRDGVGAINIRRKYLGLGPVVGVMASPIGVRYQPHMWCSS